MRSIGASHAIGADRDDSLRSLGGDSDRDLEIAGSIDGIARKGGGDSHRRARGKGQRSPNAGLVREGLRRAIQWQLQRRRDQGGSKPGKAAGRRIQTLDAHRIAKMRRLPGCTRCGWNLGLHRQVRPAKAERQGEVAANRVATKGRQIPRQVEIQFTGKETAPYGRVRCYCEKRRIQARCSVKGTRRRDVAVVEDERRTLEADA